MLRELEDWNWNEVFNYATKPEPPLGVEMDISGFTREDVEEIIAISDGENDGDHWIGVFKLKDGRYASINAWCDYSGWG